MPVLGVAALVVAHFFDYASFLVMIGRHGLSAEANPVVIQVTSAMGLPGLTLAKIVTVAFATLLVIVIASSRRRVAISLLAFGVAVGVVGGVSNILSL